MTTQTELIGFRRWSVCNYDAEPRLGSASAGYNWEPGVNIAHCRPYDSVDFARGYTCCKDETYAPSANCKCGLHAFGTLDYLLDDLKIIIDAYQYHSLVSPSHLGFFDNEFNKEPPDYYAHLCGIVKGWGKIQVHKDGFRAQFAQIMAIVNVGVGTNDFIVNKAILKYNIPLIDINNANDFAKEHGILLEDLNVE